MQIHVNKLRRSQREVNIWSSGCSSSSYRHVVFIQPSHPYHHLHPVLSPQRELAQSQRWAVRGSHIFWQACQCSAHPFSLPLLFCLSPSDSTSLRKKIVPVLSEPPVPRCQPSRLGVAEETHRALAAVPRTAHWTHLCRSVGMGRLVSCQVLIILNNHREWLITVRRGPRRRNRTRAVRKQSQS